MSASAETVLTVLRVGMQVFSRQVFVFVALIMTFALFSWAMWAGSWIATATAAGFGVAIFLPILWRTLRKGDSDAARQD